jgi:predicted outer membrane repeat protein
LGNYREDVMKKNAIIISICILILLSSCITFKTIVQPSVAGPNEIINVSITATTEGGEYEPYFGVCLPIGWTIPGDSLQCSGEYNEVIYYDDTLSIEQENANPASEGYYWWVGKGVEDTSAVGVVYGELQIQTDSQTGVFSIDYTLGNGYQGVNRHRSNGHIIEIPDEYTPSRLQATVVGESVSLIWNAPFNTNGLLGYYIYRDEQQINPVFVADTTFTDENPLEGLHYYTVSSYYSNGNEYLRPYEEQVMYGNNLYVSPNGSNNNSGASFEEALLTINYSVSCITPDSLNPKTIYLSQGIFSPRTTGEIFPLEWKNYISLVGISQEETILDGDSLSRIVTFDSITEAKFENLTIRNGVGSGWDGGINCYYSSPELLNVRIANMDGRGIWCYYSSPILENVIITGNSDGGICSYYSSPILENVIVKGNTGGGIRLLSSNPSLVNVTIINNSAEDGGGIYCDSLSLPRLENVAIINNSAERYGGGIYCNNSFPVLLNVTMTGNSATFGGGFYIDGWSSQPILKNCILWNDSPEEIHCDYDLDTSSIITLSHSDIQGGEAGIIANGAIVNWLEGNIDEDPRFVGTGDYPYSLSSGSPCIDAGNPDTDYNDPEDPNNPGYALWPAMGTVRNDMGAYGGPNALSWNIVTSIEDDKTEELKAPTEFELAQNYPNPFNPSTTIHYAIKERTYVELILYDILGREVKALVNEDQDAGQYKINLNAGGLASGIYFYRIQAGDFVETKKMVLLR